MTAIVLWTATATCSVVASIFFFRFHRATRDVFFALFSAAFAVLAVHWLLLALVDQAEHAPRHYVVRLIGYILIAIAIIVKNRG